MKHFQRSLGLFLWLSPAIIFSQQHSGYVYNPRTYSCQYTPDKPIIDGKLDEDLWKECLPTDPFIDIEGDIRPAPRLSTSVKMRWDNDFLFLAAELEEPHLWATYDQKDMVIFHENDFEVFIDPDGDAHHYYELEINARNTIWDLMLTRPYRNSGRAIDSWEIVGIQTAVHLDGTLNDPSDEDRRWTIEIALPWSVLEEAAAHAGPPSENEIWWINFSRVQWQTVPQGEGYVKKTNPQTQQPYPENNWVWSPQGAIAMHQPETWGLVAFTAPGKSLSQDRILAKAQTEERWRLWQHYYAQKDRFEQIGRYGGPDDFPESGLIISTGDDFFYTSVKTDTGWLTIDHNGQILAHKKP